MTGEHIPLFPADAKYLNQLIDFIGNVKERDKWMKRATEVIARNEKLLATLGKASQIDKLHAEAAELKEVVLAAIEAREKALVEGQQRFDAEMDHRGATMRQEEHDAGARATAQREKAHVLLSGAKQKDKAATEALRVATEAQAQAEGERDRTRALRKDLEAQRGKVKKLAEAAAA